MLYHEIHPVVEFKVERVKFNRKSRVGDGFVSAKQSPNDTQDTALTKPYRLVCFLMKPETPKHHASKRKILDAAVKLIRTKGFAATSIDDLCA